MADEKKFDLTEEIKELSGVDPADLPMVSYFVDPRGQTWKLGDAAPVKKELRIWGMFIHGEDVRVYCLPTTEKGADGKVIPLTRLTLSRQSGTLVGEGMSLDVFRGELAAELVRLAEDVGLEFDPAETPPATAQPAGNGGAAATLPAPTAVG